VREGLNAGFWFIPALLVSGAVVLFVVTQYLDGAVRADVAGLPVFFSGGRTLPGRCSPR